MKKTTIVLNMYWLITFLFGCLTYFSLVQKGGPRQFIGSSLVENNNTLKPYSLQLVKRKNTYDTCSEIEYDYQFELEKLRIGVQELTKSVKGLQKESKRTNNKLKELMKGYDIVRSETIGLTQEFTKKKEINFSVEVVNKM